MNNLENLKKFKNDSSRTFYINSENSEIDYKNGRIEYQLKNSEVFNDTDVGLKKLTMYNSFNIFDLKYDNVKFAVVHDGKEFEINIEPGMYDVDALNAYMRYKFDELGLYIENTSTKVRKYFLSIEANPIYNRVVLTASLVPTSFEDGEIAGSELTLTGKTMQLKILNNGFSKSIGFNPGVYPEDISLATQVKGQVVPKINPVLMFFVKCNLVYESGSNYIPDSIANFDFNNSYRTLMKLVPEKIDYFGIKQNQRFDRIVLQLVDNKIIPISYEEGEEIYFELKLRSRFS